MRLLLHIGTEKTGTTLLQDWLYENVSALSEQGVFLSQNIGMTNNRLLVTYFKNGRDEHWNILGFSDPKDKEAYFSDFVNRFESELRKAEKNHDFMIISSEHFHSRLQTDEEIGALYNFLRSNFSEINVICYLREQSAVRRSLYSTSLKGGGTEYLKDFQTSFDVESSYYNYYNLVSRWARFFGKENMILRPYSIEKFVEADLRKDFLSAVGKSIDTTKLDFDVHSANESLKLFMAAAFLGVNKAVPLFPGDGYNKTNELFKDVIKNVASLKAGNLRDVHARSFAKVFADSNKKLSAEFFKRRRIFTLPPKEDGEERFFSETEVARIIEDVVYALTQFSSDRLLLDEDAEVLRDVAFKFSDGGEVTKEDAIKLMTLAARARPTGPVIRNQLEVWKKS